MTIFGTVENHPQKHGISWIAAGALAAVALGSRELVILESFVSPARLPFSDRAGCHIRCNELLDEESSTLIGTGGWPQPR